ncbi:MAG: adenylate/guanylate cyclase domain-containing protein [Deltaproteobacteria bacterium]|nr:adenylate/guanylate cyclase domain-containing protein [Deltaproteobacteria bacterium]
MNSILNGSCLRELTIPETLFLDLILLAILILLSYRLSSPFFSISALILAGVYIGVVALSFFYANVIFPMIRPLFLLIFTVISILIYRYILEERGKLESIRQRDFIRKTFGRYLSNEVVDELLNAPEGSQLGGETREVTFLVSDLRGFTTLSSRLSPQDVIHILNRYFQTMMDIIGRYQGTVDELQGDGMLIFFGAPLMRDDDPERAVACAIEMQNHMHEVNRSLIEENLPELAMGIGINTGEVVVGNIGSKKRAKYGAVGTPINIAFRIESFTGGGQILISTNTFEKVKSLVRVQGKRTVPLKGLPDDMTVFDIAGIKSLKMTTK